MALHRRISTVLCVLGLALTLLNLWEYNSMSTERGTPPPPPTAGREPKGKGEGREAEDPPPHPTHRRHHHHRPHRPIASPPAGAATAETPRFYVAPPAANTTNLTYAEALSRFATFLKERQGKEEDVEQSSARFIDFKEPAHVDVRLPTSTTSDLWRRFGVVPRRSASDDVDACDPRDADFSEEKDGACLRMLADVSNWYALRPMSSILSTGRTIKFRLTLRGGRGKETEEPSMRSAVLKVSQKKFALEPASEVAAHRIDRLLKFNRAPPVVWVPFPVDFLKAASVLQGSFYAHWVELFVLRFSPTQPLQASCYGGRQWCINVSLQLWMEDVHETDATTLAVDDNRYRTALNLPPRSQDVANRLRDRTGTFAVSVRELLLTFMFDYIIGNTDRWFGHNMFTVGGCRVRCAERRVRTIGPPRAMFVDQGSSFYRAQGPAMNPFTANTGPLCRLDRIVTPHVLKAAENDIGGESTSGGEGGGGGRARTVFAVALRARLPSGIGNLLPQSMLRAAATRVGSLAAHVRSCVANFTEEEVMYF